MFVNSITILLALLPFANAAAPHRRAKTKNLRTGPCDDSFPLHTPLENHNDHQHKGQHDNERGERRLVGIRPAADVSSGEYYETGHYYAPLCPDGKHIDVRELQHCNGGACWNHGINQCTFECTWNVATPEPTHFPTHRPTLPHEEADYPLLLDLRNLPKGFRLNKNLRESILRYMKVKLKFDMEDLGLGLELLDLTSPGKIPGQPHSLPLKVKLRGPPDVLDFSLKEMMQTMEDASEEMVKDLKELNEVETSKTESGKQVFQNVTMVIDTYTFDMLLIGDTSTPTLGPTTLAPTAPLKSKGSIVIMEDTVTGLPWWAWLIIALVIVLCCICCCCYCWRRRRARDSDNKNDSNARGQQQINLFMQNRMPKGRKHRKHSIPVYGSPNDDDKSKSKSRKMNSQRTVKSQRTSGRPHHHPSGSSQRPHRSVAIHNDSDNQTRRTTRTSRTKHTHQTHRTRSSRPTYVPARADGSVVSTIAPSVQTHIPEVAIPIMSERDYDYDQETEASHVETVPQIRALPPLAKSFSDDDDDDVSALHGGDDPPEEHALVLYGNHNPTPYDNPPNYNPQGRDPTFFTDHSINPESVDPDGEKIDRKKSMFADAALMSQVRREREEEEEKKRLEAEKQRLDAEKKRSARNKGSRVKRRDSMGNKLKQSFKWTKRDTDPPSDAEEPPEESIEDQGYYYSSDNRMRSEPEGLTSDELSVVKTLKKKKKPKKSKSSKSRSDPSVRGSRATHMDKIKASFTWKANDNDKYDDAPLANIEALDSNHSGYDSPSILTQHNEAPTMEELEVQQQTAKNDNHHVHDDGIHRSNEASNYSRPPSKKKKKGMKKKDGLFDSIRRRSQDFLREGVSSDDESFHVDSDSESHASA